MIFFHKIYLYKTKNFIQLRERRVANVKVELELKEDMKKNE